ncbi:protein S100-A13 [Genypterus blacodes]|uniref:protein S100-A13 n=1 Tax=Genypterus blacodes TaxID=154954 RepID=UPI003F769962
MEEAIKTVVTTFLKSSRSSDGLGKNDFKKMVQKQLGNIMADTDSSSAIKDMQQGLDTDQDGKVSFQEYLQLIGHLAKSLSQRKTGENAAA